MNSSTASLARRIEWEIHYRDGPTPWDTGITPPEVQEFWHSGLLTPHGVALDMGCGTGTNASYLAGLGMQVCGLELSHAALTKAKARRRSLSTRAAARITYVQCDVAAPPVHRVGAVYILDIGCLHTVPRTQRREYALGIICNLAPGGYYHLFGHDMPPDASTKMPPERGLGDTEVAELFEPSLALLTVLRGKPEQRPCRWYLLRKPLAA